MTSDTPTIINIATKRATHDWSLTLELNGSRILSMASSFIVIILITHLKEFASALGSPYCIDHATQVINSLLRGFPNLMESLA